MLETFLNAKPLYYDEIDYDRMPRIYKRIQNRLKIPKIIHLIGTNGKGTTGRFLATALYSLGFSTGHYSSPHIANFNERIWLNAADVSSVHLEAAHQELLTILKPEEADALSYFEYTTLLGILIYKECDYVVLEAGLGGEYDATAVFAKKLTLVTPIAKDHEAFLGDTIKEIATTKLNAIENYAILASGQNSMVQSVAKEIQERKGVKIYTLEDFLKSSDYENVQKITQELTLAPYLQENLKLAIAALKFLEIDYTYEAFKNSRLFGRLTRFRENIIIDVGHNTLAATEIYRSLKGKKYTLVYNSYKDKNYKEILSILRPIIQNIEIIEVEDARIESATLMREALENLGYTYKRFKEIKSATNYLVFGSFSVVEAFLKVHRG